MSVHLRPDEIVHELKMVKCKKCNSVFEVRGGARSVTTPASLKGDELSLQEIGKIKASSSVWFKSEKASKEAI